MSDDVIVLTVCPLCMAVIFAAVMRPNAPDPENHDEAPEALGESAAGLLGVVIFATIGVAYILLT